MSFTEESTTPPEGETYRVGKLIADLKSCELDEVSRKFSSLTATEIASLLESLPPEFRKQAWKVVSDEQAGDTLAYLHEGVRSTIIDEMTHSDVVATAQTMDVEDLADVMEDLPLDLGDAILQALDEDRRIRLEKTLAFEEGSAGRLMSADVISVRKGVALSVVTRYLRRLKPLPLHTDALMVIDEKGVYLGKLFVNDILTSEQDATVEQTMVASSDYIRATENEKEVARMFERRELISVAVVDEQGYLLGRITVDEALDIVLAQADKALLAHAGLDNEEDLFAPVMSSAKGRAVWLGVNLITVFLAAWVIGRFEEALGKLVALAVLMPVVASMGGIAGSQTLTLTIRGLVLGQVTRSNLRWLGRKEIQVGLLNGVGWAIIVALVTYFWFNDMGIAIVIGIAITLNLLAAAISGVLIPIILHRLGFDPALSGAVVLTTITDIVGFLSFLGLATLFLI